MNDLCVFSIFVASTTKVGQLYCAIEVTIKKVSQFVEIKIECPSMNVSALLVVTFRLANMKPAVMLSSSST